jgi:DNA-directed RNA polymerase
VHDSFGCLANRATVFRDVIRQEFVTLYQQHDVLAEILDQAKRDLTERNRQMLPTLPVYGALNIKQVMNAPYCFA